MASCNNPGHNTRFVAVKSDQTGIDFANTLIYNDSLTVLEFEYMYNGAGVALIDVNNDGLQDIYFSGNMVSGQLYLNRGDLRFENITRSAHVSTSGWSNGVSIIDINQDGFKDIYICRGGPRRTSNKERENLLFINNGDNTFIESAIKYGLADVEYSVQAAFFDYDNDGDLDVYLLSNALVNFNRNTSRPKELTGKAPSVDKLYRNNGDLTFTDVSQDANILIEGFGLGVEICDINQDGWADIYVSNDFLTDDLIYINQQNGSFENQSGKFLKHQTYNGMGNDLADFNNDGLVDIVVLDMLPEDNKRKKLTMMGNNYDEFQTGLSYGYQPQYIRNTLQLNNGNGSFSEIGQLAGIEATEWSWSALFADYNNDGLKDLLVTNGYRQDITNLDFMVYGQKVLTMGTPEANRKQRLEALNELEGIKVHNYIYKNEGNLQFQDVTNNWGLSTPSYSNGAVYGDLDNDGDLDIVINNIDQEAHIYQNNTINATTGPGDSNYLRVGFLGPDNNREGIGVQVYIKHHGQIQYQYFTPYRGYLSSVEPFMHFGINNIQAIDSLEILWPDGSYQLMQNVAGNQTITLNYKDAGERVKLPPANESAPIFTEVSSVLNIDYHHVENAFVDFKVQPLLPHMHSRNGPGIAVGDINNDGLDDFYVGGASGYSGGLYKQKPDGTFTSNDLQAKNLPEDMGVLFFDADGDHDLDLYLTSGGTAQIEGSELYIDRLLLNDGSGNFERTTTALPDMRQSNAPIIAADYDQDGDLDLFIGGRVIPGSYPMPASSYLLRNDSKPGNCRFTDVTQALIPELIDFGMVTSALWTDFNNDGWRDLITVGEFMSIRFFSNKQGEFEEISSNTGLENTNGWWNSLVAGDFDNDGDIDYVAGNLGLNTRYHASPKEPLCIYANDYDKNGRIDPVMCYYNNGINYIAHSRDDLIKQINAMRARFRTYTDYAEATFERSFLPEELAEAYVVKTERFASSYIENLGDGRFTIKELPVQAQISPIFGMISDDFDADGNLDLISVGNSYSPEVSTGRYDASVGLFLKGDGKGNFSPLDITKSGFFADGDAKGFAQLILANNSPVILVANNSQKLKAYSTSSVSYYRAKDHDSYAIVSLKNGKKYKHEFYYGNTYLSGSSRILKISSNVESVAVLDRFGNGSSIEIDKKR